MRVLACTCAPRGAPGCICVPVVKQLSAKDRACSAYVRHADLGPVTSPHAPRTCSCKHTQQQTHMDMHTHTLMQLASHTRLRTCLHVVRVCPRRRPPQTIGMDRHYCNTSALDWGGGGPFVFKNAWANTPTLLLHGY